MNITLYSTHCPRCTVLEKKLQMAGLTFDINDNPDAIIALGFKTAPILAVDNDIYQFKQACDWIADYKKKMNNATTEQNFACSQECGACKLTSN